MSESDKLDLLGDNLAPIAKKPAGPTGKSGASLLSKGTGKLSGLSTTGKSTFGSTGSKSSNFGSSVSKTNNFGSSVSKTSNFGSNASKTSPFGSGVSKTSNFGSSLSKSGDFNTTPIKKSTFGSSASKGSSHGVSPKDSSSRGPSFLVSGGKFPSGHTPSTSRKTYETVSYNPKTSKSSTSFGIIWLPGRRRNKKKDMVFSSMNNDKKNERTPTMYNIMSGDSPDYQLQKKKDEETNLLIPEKVKGPIATAASAGAFAIISEASAEPPMDEEEKLFSHDKEQTKEAAGDSNDKPKDETDYLENNDVTNKTPDTKQKSTDKVDSVFITPSIIKSPPPQSTTSNPDDDDCIIKCLYYTLQCCDCSIM